MVWRKHSDTTLVLRKGCLGVWKNCQVVQRGFSNDLSLPHVYNSFSSAKSEAFWINQLAQPWALWVDSLGWWPRCTSTPLLYTFNQHQNLSCAKLQPILIKEQMDKMGFPNFHWVGKDTSTIVIPQGNIVKETYPRTGLWLQSCLFHSWEGKNPFFICFNGFTLLYYTERQV